MLHAMGSEHVHSTWGIYYAESTWDHALQVYQSQMYANEADMTAHLCYPQYPHMVSQRPLNASAHSSADHKQYKPENVCQCISFLRRS